ncbi:MAG: TRAM domain-containing protein [bacterium]|nr:TRAM domain-containing protein [bacterium]
MSEKLYTVQDLGWDGRGVARNEEGRVVMIDGGLPGDTVKAKITKGNGHGPLFGRAVEIVNPSPQRVSHPCPHHFIECFNCPLGSWRYEAALEWKGSHLKETLRRIGHIVDPVITAPLSSPEKWHYRDRLEPHLFIRDNRWYLGYYLNGKYSYIRSCLLGIKTVRSALDRLIFSLNQAASKPAVAPFDFKWGDNQSVARILLRDNGHGEVAAMLMVESPGKVDLLTLRKALVDAGFIGWQIRHSPSVKARLFSSRIIEMSGNTIIYHQIADAEELVSDPTVFSQVNRSAAPLLIERVLSHLPEGGVLLDLYGGYGSFALEYAWRKQGQATVVESSALAVKAGQKFVEKQDLPVEYIAADLGNDHLPQLNFKRYHTVLLNPPRNGAHKDLLKALNDEGPEQIVYVSCHPATLARDIKMLISYQPNQYVPIDLFPQTPDIETVVSLRRS